MSDYQRHYFGPYYAWRVSRLLNSLSEETAKSCQNVLWADRQLLNQDHKARDFIRILGKVKMPVRGQLKDLHVKYLKKQKWFRKDQQSKELRSQRGQKSNGRKQNRVVKNHVGYVCTSCGQNRLPATNWLLAIIHVLTMIKRTLWTTVIPAIRVKNSIPS